MVKSIIKRALACLVMGMLVAVAAYGDKPVDQDDYSTAPEIYSYIGITLLFGVIFFVLSFALMGRE